MSNLSRRFQNDAVSKAGVDAKAASVEKKVASVKREDVGRPAQVVERSAEERPRHAATEPRDHGRTVRGRGGRPKLGEHGKTLTATKPWLLENPPVSARTYFRHKAWIEKRAVELYDEDGLWHVVHGTAKASWDTETASAKEEYLIKAREQLRSQ